MYTPDKRPEAATLPDAFVVLVLDGFHPAQQGGGRDLVPGTTRLFSRSIRAVSWVHISQAGGKDAKRRVPFFPTVEKRIA